MIQDLTVESVLLIFLASLFGLFVGIGGAVFSTSCKSYFIWIRA